MPRPTLLWRATHSLMIAASLMLIGGGAFCYVWKQEIAEFLVGRDLDASSLIDEIQTVGGQAIEGFHPGSHYRLRWIESEIRRVADDEIRLYADVEAELAENLYLPLPERVVEEEIGYDESELLQALRDAQANFPAAMADFPTKPWDSLYRLASPKGELVPLRVVYRITRENEHADWELAGVRVRGNKADLEWPEGRRRDEFADNAYDVDSPQFKKALKDYQDRSQEFVASVGALRQNLEAEAKSVAMENRKRRDHVLKSLSQGSFFSGIAIVGEDGEIAKDVTMVITETREQGALVRGVFQARERSNVSKHFVGSVDFVEGSEGREQGYLNVTTVALDGGPASDLAATFFQPGNSSRIRLKTDGFRVEGDLSDLSLRMTRNM